MQIREVIAKAPKMPLTPAQLQVKTLKDKSEQFKIDAKKVKAQQQVQKAQAKLAKVNQASAAQSSGL